jgi:hypothetical protein
MTADEPDDAALRRRMLRVLRMVSVLHQRGYQRLRIVPGMAPSGMHWRCGIFPAAWLDTSGLEVAREEDYERGARYTSGQDNHYFDWRDAENATAARLADLFAQRFPSLLAEADGDDWAYAGWYQVMLRAAERGAFPCAFADWPLEPAEGCLATVGYTGDGPPPVLPAPPPVPPRERAGAPQAPGCQGLPHLGTDLPWHTAEARRVLARWVEPFYLRLEPVAAAADPAREDFLWAAATAAHWFTEATARQLYALKNWRAWMASSFFLLVRDDLSADLVDWIAWRATWTSHGSFLQALGLATRDAAPPLVATLRSGPRPSESWAALALGGEQCRAALAQEGLPARMDDPDALAAVARGQRLLHLAEQVRAAAATRGHAT